MATPSEALDAAIQEIHTTRSLVSKIKRKQVTGVDALASLTRIIREFVKQKRPVCV